MLGVRAGTGRIQPMTIVFSPLGDRAGNAIPPTIEPASFRARRSGWLTSGGV